MPETEETLDMHYVAQVQLRKWTHDNNTIYRLFFNKHHEAPEPTSVSSVCFRKKLYTIPGETVEQRMAVERIYTKLLDNNFNLYRSTFTKPCPRNLPTGARHALIQWICGMALRNPHHTDRNRSVMERMHKDMYDTAERMGKPGFFMEDVWYDIKNKPFEVWQKEFRLKFKPYSAAFCVKKMFELTRAREKQDIIMITRIKGDAEFIISDEPVVVMGDTYDTPIGNLRASMHVPIDPKTMVTLSPDFPEYNKEVMWPSVYMGGIGEEEIVNTFNQAQFIQSKRYVLGTEKGLNTFRQELIKSFPKVDYTSNPLR